MAAINLNDETYKELLNGNKPVLVEFWAPWCGYCRRISSAIDRIAAAYHDRLVVGKVNIDEEPRLSEAAHIDLIPTLVLYRNGKPIGSITAPDSKVQIDAFLQKALTGEEEPHGSDL